MDWEQLLSFSCLLSWGTLWDIVSALYQQKVKRLQPVLKPSHTLTLVVGYCELWASWWGEGGQGGEGQAAENITSIITMNWDEAFLCHRLEQSQGLVSWGISEFQIDKIWWCVNPRVDVSALIFFAQLDRQEFFALKYMSEQRRLHV